MLAFEFGFRRQRLIYTIEDETDLQKVFDPQFHLSE